MKNKVFISWSGNASREVASILRKHLRTIMSPTLDIFMSKHDITSGVRWNHQLTQELENTHFGIIYLMHDNLTSPWILFEAGALSKHVEDRVCGLLFNGLEISKCNRTTISISTPAFFDA